MDGAPEVAMGNLVEMVMTVAMVTLVRMDVPLRSARHQSLRVIIVRMVGSR